MKAIIFRNSEFQVTQKHYRIVEGRSNDFNNSYLSHRIIDSFPWILK